MPKKKKPADSVNVSTCSDVSPTPMLLPLALAQTENGPRSVSGQGSDNCANSIVVH